MCARCLRGATRAPLTFHPPIPAVTQSVLSKEFKNGLVLVAEPMGWLESAAFSLLVPAGCSRDPRDHAGLANFCCEMVQRGAGNRNSRQFVEDLELLGADTSASVSNAHTSFGGAMPAESLNAVLGIYADVVRRPRLPADQLEDGRLVCFQEVRAVEDDLAQKVMYKLRETQYPDPYGRSPQGTMESVACMTLEDIRGFWQTFYQPAGAILSVAGKIDWGKLCQHVETLFGDWEPREIPEVKVTEPVRAYHHIEHSSTQTHIGISYDSVPYSDADYFQARGAVGVLSDGMSSRLFTEVRENRGLCYTVQASCHSLKDRGSVICYAGTTTERAQETVDVTLAELRKIALGVEADELNRLKARIKSAIIMQQESSPSRSSSIAADWYYLGRVRTLKELGFLVDNLTCDSINAYLAAHPPRDFNIVTLGEKRLETPVGISQS